MKTLILAATLLMLSISIHADVLLIDRVEAKQNMTVPQKSLTMNQVRSQFGEPISEFPAVGDPPITRWEYATFWVFFEYQHVITSVLKKSTPTEIDPN